MNTERIDVLAVMDGRIARLEQQWLTLAGLDDGPEPPSLQDMRQARAAVAELVGFAEGMRELLSQDDAPVWAAGALDAANAALARVQGEK